jgi:hypothetical protein
MRVLLESTETEAKAKEASLREQKEGRSAFHPDEEVLSSVSQLLNVHGR